MIRHVTIALLACLYCGALGLVRQQAGPGVPGGPSPRPDGGAAGRKATGDRARLE